MLVYNVYVILKKEGDGKMYDELKPPFSDFSPDNPKCVKLFKDLQSKGVDMKEAWSWMKLMNGCDIKTLNPISDEFFEILKDVSPEWYEWTSLWFFDNQSI